ncbi:MULTISPECIES: hypothetical protein [Vibrio]|uniref:hypothetical protein n=2 Tax=Vibrio TaxID=662 RepID=UPI0011226B98|nr:MULTISPECIES: hypothetical protein [Vibrio]EJG0483161.1 hypothetical protein [Vibrio alginolyticus]EKL9831763.1 hypothetical protein [Vibrio alginolyticus]MCR9492457.1 hypothetical protein [Vibrio alginolyticus]MDW1626361.1 hypothetical protein [Vibrio sp. Vb2704]MDW1877985.1 hypothetical protein [Vibrio sp. Vb1026]
MMGIGATLFWGAVSGVIATGFLWLCGIVLYKVLLPWYQEKVYKGVDLAGRWTYETEENGATYTYQIDLEQSAHNISGTGVITKSQSDDNYIQDFRISGETWEGYLTLNMRSSTNVSLSFVSGLFKVEDRGSKLTGSWSYRTRSDDVGCEQFTLLRQAQG